MTLACVVPPLPVAALSFSAATGPAGVLRMLLSAAGVVADARGRPVLVPRGASGDGGAAAAASAATDGVDNGWVGLPLPAAVADTSPPPGEAAAAAAAPPRLVLLYNEVNLGVPDAYGTATAVGLLRQLIEHRAY